MLKILHNDKMSLGWAICVEIAVHALFAFQAFLLGGFLGEIALTVVFGSLGVQIGAWALAVFIFGAAFQAFVLGEYMREHVESFESTAKGNGSYIRSWEHVRWLVAAIEISSLLFRLYTIVATGVTHGQLIQATIVGAMGAIALWYAFAQAKVIHASVNRPAEQDVIRARDYAGRDIVSSAMELIPHMTTEQKRRFYTGDLTAVDEVEQSRSARRNEKLRPREEKKHKERQRQDGQLQDYETARKYTSTLLGGSDDPFLQAVPTHHQANGHGNQN